MSKTSIMLMSLQDYCTSMFFTLCLIGTVFLIVVSDHRGVALFTALYGFMVGVLLMFMLYS